MKNLFVLNVNNNRIVYSDTFKQRFIIEYHTGKGPKQIFIDADFNPKILGSKRIERAAKRTQKYPSEQYEQCQKNLKN